MWIALFFTLFTCNNYYYNYNTNKRQLSPYRVIGMSRSILKIKIQPNTACDKKGPMSYLDI